MPRNVQISQPDEFIFETTRPRISEKRKPLVRLVCPCCGKVVSANAVFCYETTVTACAKCGGKIQIDTDDEGAIVNIVGEEKEEKEQDVVSPDAIKQAMTKGIMIGIIAALVLYIGFKLILK